MTSILFKPTKVQLYGGDKPQDTYTLDLENISLVSMDYVKKIRELEEENKKLKETISNDHKLVLGLATGEDKKNN